MLRKWSKGAEIS